MKQGKIFQQVEFTKLGKNTFDLSHDVKMTGDFGKLMPVLVMECVPGDKVRISAETLIRFAPLISPVMHRMDAFIHYFFCPIRPLWSNWEKWISLQESHVAPFINTNDLSVDPQSERLADYLGIPPSGGTPNPVDVSAIPFACYQWIYNEYYRDENLIPEVNYKLVDGDNGANADLYTQRLRAWEHDYFTSCLPFAQKGNVVDLPIGDVILKTSGLDPSDPPIFVDANGNNPIGPTASGHVMQTGDGGAVGQNGIFMQDNASAPIGTNPDMYDPKGTLSMAPTTISDLRRAFRLQEYLEKLARGGTRYIEYIKSVFGVNSSDKRLQRPEYITGLKQPIVISEVLNTTGVVLDQGGTPTGAPQANMAGHGISVGNGRVGSFYVEEHGFIMGIMSILPRSSYSQGIPRHFLKKDPLDYFIPQFEHIGEQAVQNQELYAYNSGTFPTDTFGYIPRYAEYKYAPPRIAGDFRTSLDFWTLNRQLSTAQLNQDFIECKPADQRRIFAVEDPDVDPIYIQVVNNIRANRPMSVYSNPYI